MAPKGLRTTVQESGGKFTTPIPTALINLLGIEKGNELNWTLKAGQICIDIVRTKQVSTDAI